MPNYIVILNGNHEVGVPCDTVDEVWDTIGKRSFGALYEVISPAGKDTQEFIPF